MNLDFALILTVLTLAAAVLWALEKFWLRPRRSGKEAVGALGKTSETLGSLFPVDRKSTRLNSSHVASSYAVFCLKKKKGRDHGRICRDAGREAFVSGGEVRAR